MSFVVHRVSKSAARYTDAGGREKCGYCRFFVAPRACGKVIGPVSPAGWCKYFSRQVARQYSGAGITGGGGPPGMTLSLNFMSSGNMPAGVTFTRASTATYTDASGVIQTAAVNQPRWDYAGGSLRGLLIEEARTNLALWSANLTNAVWSTTGIAGGGSPVITLNQVAAPDGTITASRHVLPAVSGAGQGSVTYQVFTAIASQYTSSIWLRGNVGGEAIYISINIGATYYTSPRLILTTQWQRFSITSSALSAGSWVIQIGADLRDGTQTSTPAQTIFAWGAQVEQGAFPTSYIPTAGATATRAQDVCGIPNSGTSWFVSPGGSWFAEFIDMGPPTGAWQRVVLTPAGPGSNGTIVVTPSLQGTQADGTGAPATVNSLSLNTVAKIATTWAPGTGRACLNGGAVASGSLTAGYSGVTTVGIQFMFVAATDTENMSGYMRRVQYWPRVLSDAEMQQVTT